jgi:endonuclease/exonuclease/phosphatase family metal-dependent hydrolase
MKIIQVNVWMGRLLPTLLGFIKEQNADIICAQEIFSSKQPNPLTDTLQTLEYIKTTGEFSDVFFSPTSSFQAFGEEIMLGNAIFSKHLISKERTVFTSEQFHSDQTAASWVRNIRNLQLCTIKTPGDNHLTVANHHGYHEFNEHGSENTKQSIEKVAGALNTANHPLIFCADLNIVAESPYFAPLKDLGLRNLTNESKTATTLSPAHRIHTEKQVACDFVLCSKDIKINNFLASEALVSDHKALILDFDLS